MDHSPRRETWLVRRGDVLVKAGRTREAVEAYRAALALADGYGIEMPVTSCTLNTVEAARETLGGPGHDHTEIVRHYERRNGSLIRAGAEAPPPRGHP